MLWNRGDFWINLVIVVELIIVIFPTYIIYEIQRKWVRSGLNIETVEVTRPTHVTNVMAGIDSLPYVLDHTKQSINDGTGIVGDVGEFGTLLGQIEKEGIAIEISVL